jgi:hypothetical protein
MIGFGRFDKKQFRRRLMKYSDLELVKLGKDASPAASRWADRMTVVRLAHHQCVQK